jgi:hypothetical protein
VSIKVEIKYVNVNGELCLCKVCTTNNKNRLRLFWGSEDGADCSRGLSQLSKLHNKQEPTLCTIQFHNYAQILVFDFRCPNCLTTKAARDMFGQYLLKECHM